jgi:hypothetical protein
MYRGMLTWVKPSLAWAIIFVARNCVAQTSHCRPAGTGADKLPARDQS